MVRFVAERLLLLPAVLAVLSAVEWAVALALGLHRSQWTLLATAFVLVVLLRLLITWNPRGLRGSRIKAAGDRWWQAHIAWETEHPLLGAVGDGVVVFVLIPLTGLLLQRDDLSVSTAAECGAIVFVMSAALGVVGARRERRRREA